MQKKHAFEVIPRALVKTVRFPEGQAYENVQDAVCLVQRMHSP
jgi:hypothetical protein